jgi:S-methylmethionine-dependent homocysteine/selenocysteine methylase
MTIYRDALPQLEERIFLTDGGMETTLIFHDGFELPHFAAFDLLKEAEGAAAIRRYYETYARLAVDAGCGFILESPTWRASSDWGDKLGYDRQQIADVNLRSVALLEDIRDELARPECPVVISGCVGPRGDGYRADAELSAEEAASYHRPQIATFAKSGVDMVGAMTLTSAEEAIGITLGARELGLPVAISFTTETDGRLPNGQPLGDAIQQVNTETDEGPAYFMINCAHPSHFESALREDGTWRERIRGVRANASKRSHAELDDSPDLDSGNPEELGEEYRELRRLLPNLTILGGCCGTDHRHIDQISRHCVA